MRSKRILILSLLIAAQALAGQTAKKPLTHDVYDGWKALGGITLSRDGSSYSYTVNPQVGDGTLYLADRATKQAKTYARGSALRFTTDSRFALFTVVPPKAEVDKARTEKKAPKDQPKNQLTIVDLTSGVATSIDRVKAWRLPPKDTGWFAYQLEEAPSPPTPAKPDTKPPIDRLDQNARQEPKKEQPKKEDPKKKKEHATGSEWILRNASTGAELKLADVGELVFIEPGEAVLYSVSDKTGEKDGVYLLNLASSKTTTIASGKGQYKNLTIHKETGKVAFLTDRDRYDKNPSEFAVHIWTPGKKSSEEAVPPVSERLKKGFAVLNRGQLRFSFSGNRLFFATGPKPVAEAKPADPEAEKAVLDIWSYTDKVLMPQQLLQAASLRNRSFEAMLDLKSGAIVQLEDEDLESVTVGDRGDGEYGIAEDDSPYRRASSWTETPSDFYLVKVETGERRMLRQASYTGVSLNLAGTRAIFFDENLKHWMSIDLKTGATVNISAGITTPLWAAEDDHPMRPKPAGPIQALDDGRYVITDSRDLWVVAADGSKRPVCLTNGVGRLRNWRFSLQPLPRDDDVLGIETKAPILLRTLNLDTMANGVCLDQVDSKDSPKVLLMGDFALPAIIKAQDANTVLVRKGTFSEYAEVYKTDTSFATLTKLSETNPQQKDYIWGKSELVNWYSSDGVPLKGVLIKPENFDASKKYPMIVYFYEIESTSLHNHRVPAPSASTINPTMFASNGYVVFMPDIPYTIGYPGESAEKAIISGTLEMIRRGYIDPKRIGIQGQSWGGYQVMHLITRTKLYAAAGAGAAVSNMTSAYGGIRLGSGLVRQFQYEVGQSRIGGSLWDYPLRYLENSPLFSADKVETPVLMMNNDADDAVPFQQGVEMFTALRRLDKKVWMLNYNGDRHNLSKRANQKDLSMRLQQFFDYYLKGAPLPKWMAEGVPAIKKGEDYGFEPTKSGGG